MAKNKIYNGVDCHTVTVNGKPLAPRNDLDNSSSTGFSWGYAGSGPAQLALAILADYYDDEFALANRLIFKWGKLANIKSDEDWSMTGEDIENFFNVEKR
ncbi:MAG: hypothetical protein KAT71_01895 [Gammaproteobacteria bacterium]|nr:hypothetical protein [Gammaproteobacteria bacterium]